jgi:hypothetical protein
MTFSFQEMYLCFYLFHFISTIRIILVILSNTSNIQFMKRENY